MACSVSYVLYEPGNFVIGQAVKCIHWLLLDLYIQNDKQLYDIHDVCCMLCVCGPMAAHPCCEMFESLRCNFKGHQDLVLAGVCELQLSSVCITEVTVCQLTATNWLQLRSSIQIVCAGPLLLQYTYVRTCAELD